MARRPFGGTPDSIVISPVTGVPQPMAQGTAWTEQVGGTQLFDLADLAGVALPGGVITADANGLVRFQGPVDGADELWLDFGSGRVLAEATDTDERAAALEVTSADHETRLASVEAANPDPRLDALEAVDAGTRLTALEAVNADARLDALEGAPLDIFDGAVLDTDASIATHFRVILGGNRTLAAPTNPYDGAKLIWEFIQDEVGGRTVTYDPVFVFGATVPNGTLTGAADGRDIMTAVYDVFVSKWYVISFVKGYP